jgi:quercetin dioxygenase-like cupin family protein
MSDAFLRLEDHVLFSAERASKADLARSANLFVGLNTFEAGQSQRVHVHGDADKFYVIISGKARMTVGEETREAEAGTLVWAPAGIPHGVVEALERTVMLIGMSPPPG